MSHLLYRHPQKKRLNQDAWWLPGAYCMDVLHQTVRLPMGQLQEKRFAALQIQRASCTYSPVQYFTTLVLIKNLQHQVVALRGEEARQAFFDSKSLNFTEGYKILLGAVRRIRSLYFEMVGLNLDEVSFP